MFQPKDLIIPAANVYPDGVLCVGADDGVTLRAYPAGGGFECVFPPEARARYAFRLLRADELDPPLRFGSFSLDGGATYPGYTRGHKWNGWACPLFDRETFTDILTDFGVPYTYEEATDTFCFQPEGDEPYAERGADVVVGAARKAVRVYSFDGWCWEEETPDGQ